MCHYNVFAGLLSTHGTHAQVGGCPKHVEKTSKMAKNILPLGHHLRRPARAPQPRWRPKPIQLRVWFGVQEQSVLKWTPRSHTGSDLDVQDMHGKLMRRPFQSIWFEAQIHRESTAVVWESWHTESVPALRCCLSVFGPCIMWEPVRVASRGS